MGCGLREREKLVLKKKVVELGVIAVLLRQTVRLS